MARTTIHLMRHGEVHNPEGILYGRLPGYHLSTLGHQMAQQVADVLSASGHDITQVITSPLERARETGAPTAAAFGLAPTTDPRLITVGDPSRTRTQRHRCSVLIALCPQGKAHLATAFFRVEPAESLTP